MSDITDRTPKERTVWSVTDYIQDLKRKGAGKLNEEKRTKAFPACGAHKLVADPCVVVDVNGVILLWYLPGLVSPKRQVGRF